MSDKNKNKDDKKQNEKNDAMVNDLVAKSSSVVPSSAVQKALDKQKKEQEEKDSEAILETLGQFDSALTNEVVLLRDLRKKEAIRKKQVIAISEAKDVFISTGDYAQALQILKDADMHYSDLAYQLRRSLEA